MGFKGYKDRENLGANERFFSAICYLGPLCLLVLGLRRREFIKVHFEQAVTLLVTEVLIFILVDILVGHYGMGNAYILHVPYLLMILLLPINIIAAINAARGRLWRVPIIGWERGVFDEIVKNKMIFRIPPKQQHN